MHVLSATIIISAISFVSLIIVISSVVGQSMKIRDIQTSEHADEFQEEKEIKETETAELTVKAYWNKDTINVALVVNGLEPLQATKVLQNLSAAMNEIQEQQAESNETVGADNLVEYSSWSPLFHSLNKKANTPPSIHLIFNDTESADVWVYLEGGPSPEGKTAFARTDFYTDTREIVSSEVYIYNTYQHYEQGSLQTVFNHELGHAIGLGHSTSMKSVMHSAIIIVNGKPVGVIGQCESIAISTLYIENHVKDVTCKNNVQGQ